MRVAESYLRQFQHDAARTRLDEALALAQKLNNRRLAGAIHAAMGRNFVFESKPEDARRHYAEALAIARAHGDERLRTVAVGNLGELEFWKGDADRALELARESAEIIGPQPYIPFNNIAAYLLFLGRSEEARTATRTALRFARDAQVASHVAVSVAYLGHVAVTRGDSRLAARLLGYASGVWPRLGINLEYTERVTNDNLMALLREKLSADELAQLVKEGEGLTEDQVVEEALKI
jgi:tetratricopeptide (TPR) repeat protein